MKKNKKRPWTPRRPRPRRDETPGVTDPGVAVDRRASEQQMPDEAVAGRDRLGDNERQPMDPGVSDSDHA